MSIEPAKTISSLTAAGFHLHFTIRPNSQNTRIISLVTMTDTTTGEAKIIAREVDSVTATYSPGFTKARRAFEQRAGILRRAA